jgi:predicted ABC-type ATPase
LSSFENQLEFVNAELNPNNVEAAAIQASRLMIERLNTLSRQNVDFAFETTLAARTFARFLRNCQTKGYRINLVYIWLESAELAVNRVARRVASGGHNIPECIIRKIYKQDINNFVELYLPLADRFQVYDNTKDNNRLIAYRSASNPEITVTQPNIWNQIVNN